MALKGYKQSEEHINKRATSKRRGSYFRCEICNKEFWRQPSAIKKGQCKFCSKKCYQEWQKGRPKSERWKNLRIQNNLKKAKFLTKRKINKFIRNTNKYKNWRESVFKRDNWTCQKCGKRSKKNNYIYIEAHHKKPFALFPELRFIIDNGLTLCKKCHAQEPKGKEIYAITD